jgi:hypothetical protein
LLLATVALAEPLDRIAVSVGNQVITESALLLDLRVTAFMNQAPVDLSPAAKRAEAERLLDQMLIMKEANGELPGVEPQTLLTTLKARYSSEQEYRAELERYGIRETDLLEHLRAGARTMAFSDLRFRGAARISEEELRAYYDGLAGRASGAPSFEASRDQIEELLRGERALEALDEWLKTARKSVRIEFREKVFR